METIKASIQCKDEKYFIQIESGEDGIAIPISEDKPNDIKSAFNKLIARLKSGKFQIQLENVRDDLFSQVANEYITQLNSELVEVYGEMSRHGLVSVAAD